MPLSQEEYFALMGEIRRTATARGYATVERYLLESICWLLDEREAPAKRMLFQPNDVQRELLDGLWFWNVFLKARQQGGCLDPSTRVLRADLRWSRIDEIKVGDEVVAVDEFSPEGRGMGRSMRTATVTNRWDSEKEVYRIDFQDGRSVVCSGDHRWLSLKAGSTTKWRSIRPQSGTNAKTTLKVGSFIRWITKPWGEPSVEDGWIAGLMDGEGSMANREGSGCRIAISQVAGPVLERAKSYFRDRGYTARMEIDSRNAGTSSKLGNQVVHRIAVQRMDELFRLLGQTRPARFDGRRFWEGKSLPGKCSGIGWERIVAITPLGIRRTVDLETTMGTFIAEGFVSHNSALFSLLCFVGALVTPDYRVGIIDRTDQEAKKKLARVKFAYDNLHLTPLGTAFKQAIPLLSPTNDHTITFANGSQIYAATSLRGGTLNCLWISELGTIALKDPAKAEEIMGGSLEAVHPGNMIISESTHEGGRYGEHYRLIRLAQKSPPPGLRTNMHWAFHFAGWWRNRRYAVEPFPGQALALSPDQVEYFAKLEKECAVKLTEAQKNWYVLKSATQRDMSRQYPGTPEEALRATSEGAIYADLINRLRATGRVCDLVLAPECPLFTAWDLGESDATGVWLLQVVGPDIHALDFHCQNGATPAEQAATVLRWERVWGRPIARHYIPHDAHQKKAGTTWLTELKKAGLRDVKVVPRIPDVWVGINQTRHLLPRFRFNAVPCEKEFPQAGERIWPSGLAGLEGYRKKVEAVSGAEKAIPVHDECESSASALRTFCEAHAHGLLVGPSELEQRSRRAVAGPERATMGVSRPGYERALARGIVR